MPTIEGVVSAVAVKERSTPYGPKNATSFQVDGKWYSGGFKTWEIDKGDSVRLSYETNSKGYDDVTGIAVLEKGAAPSPTAAQSGVPAGGRRFPVPAMAPERTINRQNALTAATNYVSALIAASTLDDSLDYPGVIISVARRFEAYTTGDLDAAEVKAMIEEEQGGVQT